MGCLTYFSFLFFFKKEEVKNSLNCNQMCIYLFSFFFGDKLEGFFLKKKLIFFIERKM